MPLCPVTHDDAETQTDPTYGSKFGLSGTKHVFLFDCSREMTSRTAQSYDEASNSPILASLRRILEKEPGVEIHLIPCPPVPKQCTVSKKIHGLPLRAKESMASWKVTRTFVFTLKQPHLIAQIEDGYKCLMEFYKVDRTTEQRDLAFFFGDGEGAYVANALAQIVRTSGIAKQEWGVRGAYALAERDSRKEEAKQMRRNFRSSHAGFGRVELVGLWTDRKLSRNLHPIERVERDEVYLGKVIANQYDSHRCTSFDLEKHDDETVDHTIHQTVDAFRLASKEAEEKANNTRKAVLTEDLDDAKRYRGAARIQVRNAQNELQRAEDRVTFLEQQFAAMQEPESKQL